MDIDSEEENPDWNRFWSYNPSPDDAHKFGECMEDWHDYVWKKEQEKIDQRKREDVFRKIDYQRVALFLY